MILKFGVNNNELLETIQENKTNTKKGGKGEILLNLEPWLWAKALHSSY